MYSNNELIRLISDDELCEYLDKNKKHIKYIFKAFSQYIVSTDKDYLYNKAYIDSYIITFLDHINSLMEKYNILEKSIPKIMDELKMNKKEFVLVIDESLMYKNGKITINESVSSKIYFKDCMTIEIKCIDNDDRERLLIARKIKLPKDSIALNKDLRDLLRDTQKNRVINKWISKIIH